MADDPRDAGQLPLLIVQAERRLHGRLDAVLREEGLAVEQWRVLSALSDGKGRAMGELSDLVLINLSALSKMIDRMVSRALIFRAPDEADGRKVLVFISDLGLALHRRLKPQVAEGERKLRKALGKKNAEDLTRLLATLIRNAD